MRGLPIALVLLLTTSCQNWFDPRGSSDAADGASGSGDTDEDGVSDARDLDADGDGIPNQLETSLGIDPLADTDHDGVPNYLDADDRGDGLANDCSTTTNRAVCDEVPPASDADGDGIPNFLDTDSDDDGVPDSIEAGLGEVDDDARLKCSAGIGANGLCDSFETSPDSGSPAWTGTLPDHDRDGAADFLSSDYQQRQILPLDRLVEPGSGTDTILTPSKILGITFDNSAPPELAVDFHFEDATSDARLYLLENGAQFPVPLTQAPFPVTEKELLLSGGAAAQDLDGDGDIDIFFPRIDGFRSGRNPPPAPTALVLWNDGKGHFSSSPMDVGTTAATTGLFFDQDGNYSLDLIVPSIHSAKTTLLLNSRVTPPAAYSPREVPILSPSYSASAADFDGDSLLDVFITHGPRATVRREAFLLRNAGVGVFKDATEKAFIPNTDRSVTALWGDVDLDSWPDLLITADQRHSTILLNRLGIFQPAPVELTDENATGQVLGDLDNDGDLDWFVSGVWVEQRSQLPADILSGGAVGISGNRLMRNEGGGKFADITDAAHVRGGWWGWAACMADLNNDGYLDIVQANGYSSGIFRSDPSLVWLNQGERGFLDARAALGFKDTKQGRGVLCADFDGDGDVDIVTINYADSPVYWRNVAGTSKHNWMELDLVGLPPNTFAVGAKVIVQSQGRTQFREVQAGSSYATQQPYRLHFGLGSDPTAHVTVIWPDQGRSTFELVANRVHVVRRSR